MHDDYSDLIQLWLLRILKSGNTMAHFLMKDSFASDEIARALGLSEWIETETVIDRLITRYHRPPGTELTETTKEEPSKFNHEAILKQLFQRSKQLGGHELPRQSYLWHNCLDLKNALELNSIESALLHFLLLQNEMPVVCRAIGIAEPKSQRDYLKLIAIALKLPLRELMHALRPEGILRTTGLIEWEKGNSDPHPTLEFFSQQISTKLVFNEYGADSLMREVVTPAPASELSYTDYPHLKETLGYLRQHLRTVLRERRRGVNLFFYGPPGTGKSELSRVIAKEMRAALYEVSSEDEKGSSMSAEDRLAALPRAQALLAHKRALLVYDEAEEIFGLPSMFSKTIASERKAWINRMLESNQMPTIWISNSILGLDPAFTRRFDFAFEVSPPPRTQRLKTLRKICGKTVSPETLHCLAQSDDLTPAVVARAKSVAVGLSKGTSPPEVEPAFNQLIRHTLKAQGHDIQKLERSTNPIPKVYNLDYLNPDSPVQGLDRALRSHPSCRICLYGPPGTGKTTLGYWLADHMERPLHIKKASDLLRPYLGESEKEMARAFSEAKEDQAILMIDEVDSFLQDRGQATRSWEISQVNEMLTQIECFEGILIASTNLMEGIDPAALRRFDLKIRFNYLQDWQSESLLKRYAKELGLGQVGASAKACLWKLSNCTPGDFANVARQHRFRRFRSTLEFTEALAAESVLKRDRGSRKMGFG